MIREDCSVQMYQKIGEGMIEGGGEEKKDPGVAYF
jgi:hypothetical protein